jgi:hypothetical protein
MAQYRERAASNAGDRLAWHRTRSDSDRLGLKESGYVEGQNVAIEYHYC